MSELPGRPAKVLRVLGWVWRVSWLTLLLLIIALYMVSRTASRRLDRELSDRRRAGELQAIEDLIPRLPPGARNAADIYQRAFKTLVLSKGERALLLGRGNLLRGAPPKPPQEWNAEELQAARRAIATNASYFQLLEEASLTPACAFHIAWHRGWRTDLPHLPCMLWAGMLLRARAAILTREGKPEEALRSCAALLSMADHVEREPALISQHVGYCLQGMAVDSVEYALRGAEASPATCQRLFDQLRTVDLVSLSLRAMQGEEAIYGLPTFDSRRRLLHLAFLSPGRTRPLVVRLAPGLALNLDELSYLEFIGQASRAFALAWPESQHAAEQADRHLQRLPDYRGMLTKRISPPVSPELLHREETTASIGAAQIALALRSYRSQQGRYPDSLAQLEAAGWELPTDPFNQQSYHYRRQGAGFLVYSVGPDMKDDNGRPSREEAPKGLKEEQPPNPLQHYDIAFRCDR